jgi:hypothetical protein
LAANKWAKPGHHRTGKPKTGGRKRGVPNRASRLKLHLAGETYLPLEFLLAVMRNEQAPFEFRHKSAVAAAPYCHRALKAVEFTGEGGGPVKYEVVLSFD